MQQEQKDEVIKATLEGAGMIMYASYLALELENHITGDITFKHPETGMHESFKLTFTKIEHWNHESKIQ